MTFYTRPNQNSLSDIEKADLKNFEIYSKHLQKQISLHEQIQRNYEMEVQSLQNKKKSLISLIHQSLQTQIPKNSQTTDPQKSSQLLAQQSSIKLAIQSSPQKLRLTLADKQQLGKSLLLNRSKIHSKKQTSKEAFQSKQKSSINYLANINEYKHKDLVEEVAGLLKQLNVLANKSAGKEMANSSLLMLSRLEVSTLSKCLDTDEQQFFLKHTPQLGHLQKLPTSTPSQPCDQVLTSLLTNLQKEQQRLIQSIHRQQSLQIKKMVKEHLQEKTIENMRLIYKEKKRLEAMANVKEVKSNKDVVKFGYTDRMLAVIQQRQQGAKVDRRRFQ